MDKKKENRSVFYGFWIMIGLFVVMMVFSYLAWQVPSLVAGVLFMVSVFFVFVTSIQSIVPEKSMAYIALGVAIMFILYLLLSATVSVSSVLG